MKKKTSNSSSLTFLSLVLSMSMGLFSGIVLADSEKRNNFINMMVDEYKFDRPDLVKKLDGVVVNKKVISFMQKPSTSKPWHEFKKLFLSNNRTDQGVLFWKKNQHWLEKAYKVYGISPEIVVSIIGVETIYGARVGSFRVIESLYTLGFEGKRRRAFFTNELKEFLILCRDNKLDTEEVKGSFAGAMGMPQFMPSSYRAYAVDFDEDGRVDLWNSVGDVIGSVANYLKVHGWIREGKIVMPATLLNSEAFKLTKLGVKPHIKVAELRKKGVIFSRSVDNSEKSALFAMQGVGKREYWVSLKNFYVITRYNRSLNYALVVYQLAERIKKNYSG